MNFIFGLAIGIIIMYILSEFKNKCLLGITKEDLIKSRILILLRQAARWSTAAKQDENSMIAV